MFTACFHWPSWIKESVTADVNKSIYSVTECDRNNYIYGKKQDTVPSKHRLDSVYEKSMKSAYELVLVCSVSHWVVGFSGKVSWERKHVVLQFPVSGTDNTVWCVCVCVLLMCCWRVSVRAFTLQWNLFLRHTCCWHWQKHNIVSIQKEAFNIPSSLSSYSIMSFHFWLYFFLHWEM